MANIVFHEATSISKNGLKSVHGNLCRTSRTLLNSPPAALAITTLRHKVERPTQYIDPSGRKNAGLQDDRLQNQFDGAIPPYFSSHFNSSLTLILPCQGFLPSPWPSPGKIRSLLGTPSE